MSFALEIFCWPWNLFAQIDQKWMSENDVSVTARNILQRLFKPFGLMRTLDFSQFSTCYMDLFDIMVGFLHALDCVLPKMFIHHPQLEQISAKPKYPFIYFWIIEYN